LFDTIIKNGHIVDGTGNPWFKADIGIKKGRTVNIGNLRAEKADKEIDATGRIVSPGFIDIHSHSDVSLLANSMDESKVRQGVTLELNGNCGSSGGPVKATGAVSSHSEYGIEVDWSTFDEYCRRPEKVGRTINVASLVGHANIRRIVMGNERRLPTDGELKEMRRLVGEAMAEGAFGLSTGLEFTPGMYSDLNELVELCEVVAEYDGIYATHQRNRDIKYEEATKEAIDIGKAAGVHVHLSHFSARYPSHGKTPALLWMVDEARRNGVNITFDVITPNDPPQALRLSLRDGFHWAAQSLAPQLIPPWGFEGGIEKVIERCRDPAMRERFRAEHVPQWKLFGAPKRVFPEYPDGIPARWDRILLNYSRASPELVGRTFEEIAKIKGKDPWNAALDVVVDEGEKARTLSLPILGASTAETDSLMAMKHPVASICSDRAVLAPYGVLAKGGDPNSYGAFPRVFRKYVRERGIFTVEEAVKKMTSIAAQSIGLRDRGMIREGMCADITVFDQERIADKATIEMPTQYPEGIDYVLVNGLTVIERGKHTGALPGRVLRKGKS